MSINLKAANRVKNFYEKLLTHTTGQWAGKPFILEDWQWNGIIKPLFGTLNKDGMRQYRKAFIFLPRKNGKSELAAGIANYCLFADGEQGGEIYGAACDREQASLVFNVAAQMVRNHRVLDGRSKIIDSQKRIIHPSTGSFYRATPADVKGSFGYNASAIIVDELHAQPNRDLVDTLVTSTGARQQPLIVYISTAGYDRNSICYEEYDYAKKVLSDVIKDSTYFAYIREADVDDDWTDEAIWYKANPALGSFRSIDEMRDAFKKAVNVPAYQNTFRRLYLNQWTQQHTRWIDIDKWDATAGEVDVESLKGKECFAGLDLASTTDIAAFVLVFPQEFDKGPRKVIARFWIPEENIVERARKDKVPYDAWVRDGFIKATPGTVIDYEYILKDICELGEQYNIKEIAFDRWGAVQITQQLDNAGFTVLPFGQGVKSMSPPCKDVIRLILQERLHHGGDPVLRWMADNVAVEEDAAGNIKPNKAKSTGRIDGIVAMLMALDRCARHNPDEGKSVYDTRGLVMI